MDLSCFIESVSYIWGKDEGRPKLHMQLFYYQNSSPKIEIRLLLSQLNKLQQYK